MQEIASDIDEPTHRYCNDIVTGNETGHVESVTRYFMLCRGAPAESHLIYLSSAIFFPACFNAECAAARRATGTRNGEQET